jgi:hypothetical protein
MGCYSQRKRFDDRAFAERTAARFHEPQVQTPGIEVRTRVVEEADGFWLYLTQDGPTIGVEMAESPEMILPGWERIF